MPEDSPVLICDALTDRCRAAVEQWFSKPWKTGTESERIAADWLFRDGKRWRPLLLTCTYSALNHGSSDLPDDIRRLAVAVECFHKASLVHDDIEDGDDLRYGEPTLHKQYGIPVALNVGDLLVSEGYRQITTVENRCAALLRAAAENHRMLCLGQGEELIVLSKGIAFTQEQMIEIFRHKTAPAVNVSLQLGAIAAGADSELLATLHAFSESLGIAYQIHDDLDEFRSGAAADLRASILTALAGEPATERIAVEKAGQLLEHYKTEALRTLDLLRNDLLKNLLRRVAGRMLAPDRKKPQA